VLVLTSRPTIWTSETLELLESLLQEYEGTLFLVSHDREFLDNVVTQTIASEGGANGRNTPAVTATGSACGRNSQLRKG